MLVDWMTNVPREEGSWLVHHSDWIYPSGGTASIWHGVNLASSALPAGSLKPS